METLHSLNPDTVKSLQELIEINIDSAEGFTTAAEKIESKEIAQYFQKCASQRSKFASELKSVVNDNGESPEDDGSVLGTMHRWWLELRGTVQGGDEHAVLCEAERGEDAIKERYEQALEQTAGSPINAVLLSQYRAVKDAHDRIRA
ncbi:MAG: PA2169 family four-helix-bundle protein, partial [Phycisphaerales bacterium]|nr:PA2169 family four-helix-bundle protein [Phycisphaerales bacterium]